MTYMMVQCDGAMTHARLDAMRYTCHIREADLPPRSCWREGALACGGHARTCVNASTRAHSSRRMILSVTARACCAACPVDARIVAVPVPVASIAALSGVELAMYRNRRVLLYYCI